jgi:T-complex protein 1 subunit gamma
MKEYGIWEPYAVKAQTIKTCFESACLLLRVDDVLSGLSQVQNAAPQQQQAEPQDMPDQ